MDITRIIGCRFFKAETLEDTSVKVTELYKVVGLQNEATLKVKDLLHNGNNLKVDKAAFEAEYTLLEPDAYILFSTVYLQDNIEDVIVSMFRTKDMSLGSSVPYCVCRQNILNLHNAMIRTQDVESYNAKDVGMCMSLETIPDGTDYGIMRACNGMKHYTMVAAYMDDRLDDMLSCLKLNKFDNVLEDLFNQHLNNVTNKLAVKDDPIHMGYCRSLKSLLEYNSFMYDFRRAFGIGEISLNLAEGVGTIDGKLCPETKNAIQRAYNKYILDELVIKFDKDIDIDDIKQDKIMVADRNDNIYIITYTEGSKYIEDAVRSSTRMNPAEKLEAVFKSNPAPAPITPKSFNVKK